MVASTRRGLAGVGASVRRGLASVGASVRRGLAGVGASVRRGLRPRAAVPGLGGTCTGRRRGLAAGECAGERDRGPAHTGDRGGDGEGERWWEVR